MIQKLKTEWFQFKLGKPGQRFYNRHQRLQRETLVDRITQSALGIIFSALGIALIPLPGPGTIVAVFGLCLLGSEFLPVARWLDRTEVKLRPKCRPWIQKFEKLAKPVQIGIELGLVVLTAGISMAISRMMP